MEIPGSKFEAEGTNKRSLKLLHNVLSFINHEPVMVILIVSLSAILRILYIFSMPGLGYDESTYLLIAKQILQSENAYYDFPLFTSPFYVYALSAFLYVFRFGEFQARLFSTMMGSFTTFLLYLIGKKLRGRRFGIIVSLLYSTSSFIIHMDSVNEIEPFLGMMIFLAVLVLLKYKETGNGVLLIPLGFLTATTFFTKTSALFIVLSFPLLILFWKGRKEFFITLITQVIAALLLFTPFLIGASRLTVFNVFGYSLVRAQKNMGALGSLQYIMWVHGDAGFVILGSISILFLLVTIIFVVVKNKDSNLFTLIRRREAAIAIPPLLYLLSFVLVNFWWPYLLYPPFIFLQFSTAYLIDVALTKIPTFDLFKIKSLKKFPINLPKIQLTQVLRLSLILILIGTIAVSFATEARSIANYASDWQHNREILNSLVDFIHNATEPSDIIFSTSPSVSFLLNRNVALLRSPFTSLDMLNSLRFKAYYEYNLKNPLPEALFLRANINIIEAKSYNETLFPLMERSKYIFVDDIFIVNVPNYDAVRNWLFQNAALATNPDLGNSLLYLVLGKNEKTTLWRRTNANTKTIIGIDTAVMESSLGYDIVSNPTDTQWFLCEVGNNTIPLKKNVYLQIPYITASNLDTVYLSFIIEMANGSRRGMNWQVPHDSDTDRQFAQFFELYSLLKPFSRVDGSRLQAIYIGIGKPTSGILHVEFPISVFEIRETE